METPILILSRDRDDHALRELDTMLSSRGFYPHHHAWTTISAPVADMRRARLCLVVVQGQGDEGEWSAIAGLRAQHPACPIVMLSANKRQCHAVDALRAGVDDYLDWPHDEEALSSCLARLVDISKPQGVSRAPEKSMMDSILVGHSLVMRRIKTYIRTIAHTDASVLVTGETGTGKERVAQAIHRHSLRSNKDLVCLNCAAIPESLLESELFGYERGAFTGADTAYKGKLRAANHGTVFLDEIGDMSPMTQAKLLRVIESKEIFPLGGKRAVNVDFRIVAATNRDLEHMIEHGDYRQDLFYRLNVARVHLPPLRERKEDIPQLIVRQLDVLNRHYGTEVEGLDTEAQELLINYDWPGNVRELMNALEAALIICPRRIISVSELPKILQGVADTQGASMQVGRSERDAVLAALLATNWNKSKAAKKLNWSRMTLYRKMHKYQIEDAAPG